MSNWIFAFCGGLMIGLASLFLFAANGQVAGISGILGRSLEPRALGRAWRLAFLTGLVLTGAIWAQIGSVPAGSNGASWLQVIAAGFLVGFGTQLGSGCTSGHGICGLGRRSKRSFFAVASFMLAGMATVFVMRHVVGG
jgi:uncharacterized membrane protein YedE/YeeE